MKVPDAKPRQLAFAGIFLPTGAARAGGGLDLDLPRRVDPRLVLTAYASEPGQDGLGVDSGVPQSVYALDSTNLTQLTDDGRANRPG